MTSIQHCKSQLSGLDLELTRLEEIRSELESPIELARREHKAIELGHQAATTSVSEWLNARLLGEPTGPMPSDSTDAGARLEHLAALDKRADTARAALNSLMERLAALASRRMQLAREIELAVLASLIESAVGPLDALNAAIAIAAKHAASLVALRGHVTAAADALGGSGDPRSTGVYKLLERMPQLPFAASTLQINPSDVAKSRTEWATRAAALVANNDEPANKEAAPATATA